MRAIILLLVISVGTVFGGVVFEADFESGRDATTGTIRYNSGRNLVVTVGGENFDSRLGVKMLLADPMITGARATDFKTFH